MAEHASSVKFCVQLTLMLAHLASVAALECFSIIYDLKLKPFRYLVCRWIIQGRGLHNEHNGTYVSLLCSGSRKSQCSALWQANIDLFCIKQRLMTNLTS